MEPDRESAGSVAGWEGPWVGASSGSGQVANGCPAGGALTALLTDTTQVNVGLQDLFAPTVAKVRLLDDGDRSGRLSVGFDEADLGGGLYRTIVEVEGKPARTTAMGGPPCTDALASDGDPYQFDVPVPCPRAVTGARATVDVRSLAP